MKILYIDNCQEDLELASHMFECFGTHSILKAYDQLKTGTYTHCVVDLNLDCCTGFEVIKRLKGDFPDIDYILTSGYIDKDLAEKTKFKFISKPVTLDKITNGE